MTRYVGRRLLGAWGAFNDWCNRLSWWQFWFLVVVLAVIGVVLGLNI